MILLLTMCVYLQSSSVQDNIYLFLIVMLILHCIMYVAYTTFNITNPLTLVLVKDHDMRAHDPPLTFKENSIFKA